MAKKSTECLPYFENDIFGSAPNAILRTAIFACVKKGNRQHYQNPTVLASIGGVTITGMGTQLDQSDLDVWLTALRLGHDKLGQEIKVHLRKFLRMMGRNTGKSDREWLLAALERINAFTLKIRLAGKYTYQGHLIHDFVLDEEAGDYVMYLNPKLVRLFEAGHTIINYDERRRLRGKSLALWLSVFYATHKKPYPMKVETLHRLSGSHTEEMKSFKQKLIEALDTLKAEAIIEDFSVENDLVSVSRRRQRDAFGKPFEDEPIL